MKNLILFISFLIVAQLGYTQEECLTIYTDEDIERLPSFDVEIVDSKICVSTYYGGFYIIENEIVTSIDTFNVVLPDIVIRNMCKYSDGLACSYRLGTTTTIYSYDFEKDSFKKIIDNEDILPNDQISQFSNNIPLSIKSKDNLLLIGTSAGLSTYTIDGNYQQIQDLDDDGVIDFVFDIDTNSDSEAWICTNSGVFTMDYLTFNVTKITDETCSQIVINQNEEVIFTDRITDKLYKYSGSTLEEIAASSTIISFKDVKDIEVDSENRLFFITPNEVIVSEDLEFEKLFDLEEGSSLASDDELVVAGGRQVIVYDCPVSNLEEGKNLETSFSIYPQIALDELQISVKDGFDFSPVNISIVNAVGIEVLNDMMYTHILTLEIGQLPAGIYYVILKNRNGTVKKSFIKI